jgi:hypothetical protein
MPESRQARPGPSLLTLETRISGLYLLFLCEKGHLRKIDGKKMPSLRTFNSLGVVKFFQENARKTTGSSIGIPARLRFSAVLGAERCSLSATFSYLITVIDLVCSDARVEILTK